MKCATCDITPVNLATPAGVSTPPAKWRERGSLLRVWRNWLATVPSQDETAAPGRKRVIVPRWYW